MAFEMFVDAQGIPFSNYGIYAGIEIGWQRSVLSVAERGIWCCNEFELAGAGPPVLLSYDWTRWPKNRDANPCDATTARTILLRCADWLLQEVKSRGQFLVWEYPYPTSYATRAGWRSSHAQAVGIQLLIRAAMLSSAQPYARPIDGLLSAFRAPVAEGGLLEMTESGPWFEKFADPINQKPKVLNGMLFAILGLLDTGQRLNKQLATDLAWEGMETVSAMLSRYDLGAWSAYDILGKPASRHYHEIHLSQLEKLHVETGRAVFGEWRDRWTRGISPASLRLRRDSDVGHCNGIS